MADKNKNTASKNPLKTMWGWFTRMFMGASKTLDALEVEKIESPSKQAVKAFFRRKLAVGALVVLISLFLLVFIGPLFIPMDVNYTDALQKNIAPVYSMCSVPRELADNIRNINGFSNFTVGVDKDNNFYIWGSTKDHLSKIDYSDTPEQIQPGKVFDVAAGADHIIAITTDGKVVGWGTKSNGQYGTSTEEAVISMPDELINGAVDTSKVQQLIAGYQATALVVDGKAYFWGNGRNYNNLKEMATEDEYNTDVQKVALTNYYAVALKNDGTITGGKQLFYKESAVSSMQKKPDGSYAAVKSFKTYLMDKKVVDVAGTNNCFAFLTDEGEILVWGAAQYGENVFPTIPEGEKVVALSAGTRHFTAVTDKGHTYAWGHNADGQTNINGLEGATVYTGAKQTYVVNENGELTKSVGLKGYLFGTDQMGRDILTRIIHGGKMTMTIGAVAVIVSSIIAIIVGCISGYFGGWVDILLMRITEIFGSIPFLPFAMMLSFIIRNYPIEENTRIFIIMVMLGLLSWTGLARMIRAQVLSEREKEFVIAAQSMGVKENRIAFKHILPNVISVILVSMTLDFAGCLLTESSLSYLGFGVQLPQPTWGNMLDGANNSIVIQNFWWQWLFPSIFLSIATITINIIGDTLRDVLDPKSSREK